MKREVKHNGRSKTRKRPHGAASQRSEAPGGKSRQDFCPDHEIDAIENAVNKVLDKGLRTADNMSEGCTCLGCTAMGDAILAEI